MATDKKVFNGKSEIFHESFEFLMENGLKNDCFLIENVPGKLNRYEKNGLKIVVAGMAYGNSSAKKLFLKNQGLKSGKNRV